LEQRSEKLASEKIDAINLGKTRSSVNFPPILFLHFQSAENNLEALLTLLAFIIMYVERFKVFKSTTALKTSALAILFGAFHNSIASRDPVYSIFIKNKKTY
jgi:hypothetical protein